MVERLDVDPHFSERIAKEWTRDAALSRRAPELWSALASAALAAVGVIALLGFTVDDAWISARVASHIHAGQGYRFNISGPEVDAVTPFGWAHLLAPFAANGPEGAWRAARLLGAIAWVSAALYLGTLVARAGTRRRRFLPLLLLPVSAPLGAWASSGMETGVVTALATLALGRGGLGLLCAGLAAALRPELVPWAATLGLVRGALGTGSERVDARNPSAPSRPPERALASAAAALLLTLGPALGVALLRRAWFGDGPPLAWLAKPPSFEYGARYALGALCFTGMPVLAIARPRTWLRLDNAGKALLAASAVHFLALVVAGGDWMAFYRLAVPILPGFVLLGAILSDRSSWPALTARLAGGLLPMLVLLFSLGPTARRVTERRQALIIDARRLLSGAKSIAALDVGWVGAASNATIVDLGGVTDPRVARLPGPHTNKRLPRSFVESRSLDAMVLLLAPRTTLSHPWWTSKFHHGVERRLAELAAGDGFAPCGQLALGGSLQEYVVIRRRPLDPVACAPDEALPSSVP